MTISKTIDEIFHSIRYNIPLSQKECKDIIEFPNIESQVKRDGNRIYTVLEYALIRGNLSLLDYVLDNPNIALVEQENINNENIIFSLVKERNIDYFKYFLMKYYNKKHIKNSKDQNILQKICLEKWVHGYEILKNINKEAFENHFYELDKHGNTLAHYAVMKSEISKSLLWYLKSDGLDINQSNKYRQNILFLYNLNDIAYPLSSILNHRQTPSKLIKEIIEDFKININQQDINGDYPLLIALINKEFKLASTLIENKANAFLENIDKESAAQILFKKYKNNKKILKENPLFLHIINKYNFKNQISN